MRFNRIAGNSGYIQTKDALISTYQLSEREMILFDSGKETCEELFQMLKETAITVKAVVCTHLHVDHIANNEELFSRYGTKIFAHPSEIAWLKEKKAITYPIYEIGKQACLRICGVEIGVLPTPGHTPGHLAYVTPDEVCILGDAIMSRDVLKKSKMPYMEDIDQSIHSMEAIKRTRYPFYTVAHQGVVLLECLDDLVDENINKELELYEVLRQYLTTPMREEELVSSFLREIGVRSEKKMNHPAIRQTARARIHALIESQEFLVDGEMVLPRKTGF